MNRMTEIGLADGAVTFAHNDTDTTTSVIMAAGSYGFTVFAGNDEWLV